PAVGSLRSLPLPADPRRRDREHGRERRAPGDHRRAGGAQQATHPHVDAPPPGGIAGQMSTANARMSDRTTGGSGPLVDVDVDLPADLLTAARELGSSTLSEAGGNRGSM